ncbi:MAG TPA: hypothetical protein VL993_09285 [Stellaceae bacterium]|nr:hypothetical protein [Stellaceae bacterium]
MYGSSRRHEFLMGAVILTALCVAYFLDPNARLDFSAFDTRDAENYLALSWSLVTGHGYTRSLDPSVYIPHATWPPGLPLLLAPFTFLSGVPLNLLVVKMGMIAYGVAGILLSYLYARRMARSSLARLSVPLLLGLNPYYWQFSRMANCEMPTVLWSLVALLLADIGWARGTIGRGTAFAFGLVSGFGMLIRGSFFGALFLPLTYLFVLRREPVDRRAMVVRYLCYAVGFVLPFGSWMARNSLIRLGPIGPDANNQFAMIFRESPVDPASPFRSLAEIWSDVVTNLRDAATYLIPKAFVPGLWTHGLWSELGAWSGPLAACLSLALVLLSCRAVRNLPIILMYGSMAALNVLYADGGMARLWVPVTCLLAISLPIAAETLPFPRHPQARGWCAAIVLAALAVGLVSYTVDHERHPYHDANFAALAQMFSEIRDGNPIDGNVLTPDPQAFELYTGDPAPMSLPAIGVDPVYSYVILPSAEWAAQTFEGTVVAKNGIWSLVAFATPTTLPDFRRGYNCDRSSIASFAVVSDCLIR